MESPEVTVCIPVLNNVEGCKALIADWYRLHDPSMFRILVLDQTKEGIIFDEKSLVHLHIRPQRSLGWSKAVNIMWKLAGTPYTLLANDDVRLLDTRWYEDAKAHLKEDVLAVNPFPALRTWDGGGTPRWYWEIHGEEKWGWTKDKPIESYTPEDYDRLKKLLWGGDSGGTTFFYTLFRTEARELVGLIDEAYPINGSDYDYNRRIFLTCVNCQKRKYEHLGELFKCAEESSTYFKPYRILTCTHSLVQHECGVTKQNLAKSKELDGYQLIAQSKNIFNEKWKSEDCKNPDIYGRNASIKPNLPWVTEQPL